MIKTAIQAAKEAEKIILSYYQKELAQERKIDKSLVTIADREAEAKIREVILNQFPEHKITGEEEGESGSGDSKYRWYVDPLDGTTNYSFGLPIFATAIALYESDNPILAVINLPALGIMITAEKGKGAFVNEERLAVSTETRLDYSLVALGYGHNEEIRQQAAEIFAKLAVKTRSIRILGTAVTQGALVGLGKIDAYISTGVSKWDYAATNLIVTEAGGTVTDLAGKNWSIESVEFLASNGKIHSELVEILKAR